MALLIIMDLFVAQKFGPVMEQGDRLESRADHASPGTIVATLFIFRLILLITPHLVAARYHQLIARNRCSSNTLRFWKSTCTGAFRQ